MAFDEVERTNNIFCTPYAFFALAQGRESKNIVALSNQGVTPDYAI
jgi:hypothetical protein